MGTLMQNAITLNKETTALSLMLGFLMKAEIQMLFILDFFNKSVGL